MSIFDMSDIRNESFNDPICAKMHGLMVDVLDHVENFENGEPETRLIVLFEDADTLSSITTAMAGLDSLGMVDGDESKRLCRIYMKINQTLKFAFISVDKNEMLRCLQKNKNTMKGSTAKLFYSVLRQTNLLKDDELNPNDEITGTNTSDSDWN